MILGICLIPKPEVFLMMESKEELALKKTGILNSEISCIIANMGHTDMLAIVDLGFPIPQNVKKVDLVVDKSKPDFLQVTEVVLKELEVEKLLLAEEMKQHNSEAMRDLIEIVKKANANVEVEFVSHETFKKITEKCKGIVRTGSDKPYSNAILVSGVIF